MNRTNILQQIKQQLRQEAALLIAALGAAISMFWLPPSGAYWDYIDWQVLCLLFALMLVIAGMQSCNLFQVLAEKTLALCDNLRSLSILFTLLPFFTAMFITNDVALITFVPLTILIFRNIGRQTNLIWQLVLETMAANLGSMAMPVGNPQNLFLFSHYHLASQDFFGLTLPFAIISLVFLFALAGLSKPTPVQIRFRQSCTIQKPLHLAIYFFCFLLCLLMVFHLLPYGLTTFLVAAVCVLLNKKSLQKVDYSLLLTFVCFFIFTGNLSRIPAVHQLLSHLLSQAPFLTAVGASQIISNVPAAILLAQITTAWQPLLLGVNIGGLGTLVASLASLITFRYYLKTENARVGRYLWLFSLTNLAGLALLSLCYLLFSLIM